MSHNGSGAFIVDSSGQPVVPSTLITSATFNAFTADVATGLSTAICKDGQTTLTADIPFNNKKITGLAAGALRTDAASLATIQDGTGVYVGTVGGTADVITLTASPAITAYVAGQTFRFLASGANTTNVTVAINGLAAKAITKNGTTALVAGDIPASTMAEITYDGTRFILGTIGASTVSVASAALPFAGGNMTGGINEKLTTIASAATPDLFALTVGNTIDYTGTATCTGFVASPQAGAQRTLICAGAAVFTAGANMLIDGVTSGINFTAVAGDKVLVIAVTTTQFRLTVLPVSGQAIVGSPACNPIINGSMMEVWQRGTTFPAAASATFGPDRFRYDTVGSGVVTLNRSTNVPSVAQAGVLFNYSFEVDVTTADASIAATDRYWIRTTIEGYNWRHFAQRQITLSFWVMSSKTGIHSVALQNIGPDKTYVAEYTVNAADTWEYKTVTVTASPSAGTWDYTNALGVSIQWALMAGSNFTTSTLNTWNSNSLFVSTNQVNVLDNVANFFRITGVKMELGSVATPIQFVPFETELMRAKRYYQKSFQYATAPAQNLGSPLNSFLVGKAAAVANISSSFFFAPSMRAAPTITLYNPEAANAQVRYYFANLDATATAAANQSESQFNVTYTGNAGGAVGDVASVEWTAEAEL